MRLFRLSSLSIAVIPAVALSGACGNLAAYYPEGRTVDPIGTDSDTDEDTDTDSDTDPDTNLIPLEITEVSPAHGTSAGGVEVEIVGGPFDNSAEVYFGERKGSVIATGRTWLTVETPSGSEGAVDVRVRTETGEGEMTEAFNYWLDGSGRMGTYGSLSHTRYLGTYWCIREPCETSADLGTPEPQAGAIIAFLEPSGLEWWENWAPAFNQCRSDYEPTLSATAYNPGVTSMTLRRSSTTGAINLQRGSGETPDFYYVTTGNITSGFANGTSYSIESRGGENWPAFEMPGAVSTPDMFSIFSPVVNSSTLPTVRRSNFRVEWTGGDGDYVVILAERFGTTGSLELVSCVVDDNGAFTIPSTAWSGWSVDNQVRLQVGRVKEPTGVVPFNNARSGVVGVQWVVGAAVTQ